MFWSFWDGFLGLTSTIYAKGIKCLALGHNTSLQVKKINIHVLS